MMFGWQAAPDNKSGAPIPLYYDYETFHTDHIQDDDIVYYGFRPKDTLIMHKEFTRASRKEKYHFSFPPLNSYTPEPDREEEPRPWEGMNPSVKH